jgi:hypothetical protein
MAAPKHIRPIGQGDLFSGVFTEGIGTIGGMSPKVGGGGSAGGGGSTTKGNLGKLWNRLMNSIRGTKNKDWGNPTMWHNTSNTYMPNQIKNIKNKNIKKQLNDTYWNYLRLDGAIPAFPKPSISLNPKAQISSKNIKQGNTLVQRLFNNPKIRSMFVKKTGSLPERTHSTMVSNRELAAVKNPRIKQMMDQPTGLNTSARNKLQNTIETKIKGLELDKKNIIKDKSFKKRNFSLWKNRIREINFSIKNAKKDLKNLGLESKIISPTSGRVNVYGEYKPNIMQLAKSIKTGTPLKSVLFRGKPFLPPGLKNGGIVSILDIINNRI